MKLNPKTTPSSSPVALRRLAKARLKVTTATRPLRTEADLRRLQQELKVHQVELELQNEELKQANVKVETLLDQYAAYYDFAPVGYFNLNPQGVILTGNFAGARLLGVERSQLVSRPFGRFVAVADRGTFSAFLQKVFSGQVQEGCEVTLAKSNPQARLVQIEGARSEDGQECRVVVFDITERRRVEDALAASEIRYRRLFESAKDGILILNAVTGMVVDVNPFLIELLGFPRENFLGKQLWDLGFFEDIIANQDNFAELRAKEYIRYDNKALETVDGRRIHVEFVSNIYLVNGQKVIQCNIRDITERKRAEAGLHRVNRALRTISCCNQALVRAGTEADLLTTICQAIVNEGGYRLAWVGYAEQDEGKTVRPVACAGCEKGYLKNAKITWADTERGRGPTGVAIRTGRPATCGNFLTDPHFAPWRDAAIRLGFASSAVMPLQMNGKVFGALSIYASETGAFDGEEMKLLMELADDLAYGIAALRTKLEHQRTEEALRRSETELTEAQRIACVGSWWMDSTTGEVVWTEALHLMFGLDPAQAPPPYHEQHRLFTAESWQRLSTAVQRTLETGAPYGLELEMVRSDGRKGWLLVHGEQLRNAQGGIIGLRGTAQDITERKEAEAEIRKLNAELEQRVAGRTAELEAANRELEAFSYSVSHDLRAPLRHVTGFVELLKESAGPALPETSRRHLNTISEAAKRMGGLIDDLLAFSRVGRTEMKIARVELDQLVRETLGDFQADTAARKIVWKINPLPEVRADRALLRLMLVNLISNAVKFTSHRATAKIEIGEVKTAGENLENRKKNLLSALSRDETVIYIRDNGAGFDPQYAGKLFGVFQRLHSQEDFAGTGIGLANVQRIIHRHGGRVWAEGAVDGGATFYFSLPKQNGDNHEH